MMPSVFGLALPGSAYLPGSATEALHDDLSRQMAASQAARRLSRGSNGQRTGSALRVVKPTSANNSPRSSLLSRRRTLMHDANLFRRKQQLPDQTSLPLRANELVDPVKMSRPLSWHPSTMPHPQSQLSQPAAQYPFPASGFSDAELYSSFQPFPPTPAAYSCNTSPSGAFSPLTLPFAIVEPCSYTPVEGWNMIPQGMPSYVSPASETSNVFSESFPSLQATSSQPRPSISSVEWNSFVLQGFAGTSPPTPESLPPAQQPQPALPSEDSIPYEALEAEEEEGEILVGMGLYDAPPKYDSDPQLDNYRTTMSSLFGTAYRVTHATGKGLKLEESWQPPVDSDDEEDDEADDEEEVNEDANGKQQSPRTAASDNWI